MNNAGKVLLATVFLGSATFVACEQEGPAERAGAQIDKAVNKIEQKADEATEKVKEGLDAAGQKVEQAGNEIQKKVE